MNTANVSCIPVEHSLASCNLNFGLTQKMARIFSCQEHSSVPLHVAFVTVKFVETQADIYLQNKFSARKYCNLVECSCSGMTIWTRANSFKVNILSKPAMTEFQKRRLSYPSKLKCFRMSWDSEPISNIKSILLALRNFIPPKILELQRGEREKSIPQSVVEGISETEPSPRSAIHSGTLKSPMACRCPKSI